MTIGPRARTSVLPRELRVLASYAILACALTWPLLAHFATHVPGDGGDDPALVWNLWWVRYSLLRGGNPFWCDFIFYPLGINLAFYTLTVLNGCLSLPLRAVMGLVPTSNVVLLSSYVLGGYGAYLLARHVLGPRAGASPAAWFAGLVYAFAAPKLFYAALGQFNIASSQWMPFAVMYLLRSLEESRRSDWLMAVLFMGFQAWAEMTYASFLLVFLGLLVTWRVGLAALSGRSALVGQLRFVVPPVTTIAVGFLAVVSPLLANMVPDLLREGDFTVVEGGFADVFSADLAGFLVPTVLHPWLGHVVESALSMASFDKGQHLYFGLSVWFLVGLAVVAAARRSGLGFWFLAAVSSLLLCLGPDLLINGQRVRVPMPFEVLQELPIFKANRYPSRYSVLLALALAMLGAAGLQWLAGRCAGRRRDQGERGCGGTPPYARAQDRGRAHGCAPLLAGGFGLIFLLENLSVPLPLSDMRIPAIYAAIRDTPGDFAVLEIPLGWRNGFRITGAHHVGIMFSQYYQTYHEKRLLGGNTSRNPEFKFQYSSEMPVLETLVALQAGLEVPEDRLREDRELVAQVLSALKVRYVVTHEPPADERMLGYVEEVLPTRLLAHEGGVRLYAVEETSHTGGDLDLRLVLAEGWSHRQGTAFAVRRDSRLLVPGQREGSELILTLRGFREGDAVRVRQQGRAVGECALSTEWSDCHVTLPASESPVAEVWLVTGRLLAPGDAPGERLVGQTGVESPVDIYVRSAGEEFGDFGHIYVGGQDVSSNGRGYNIAVIDPASGDLVSREHFDTHADPGASEGMAEYVLGLDEGVLVAVAVADEGSRLLGEEGVLALGELGGTADLRGCFRCGHALIGVKGAPPGSAVESWGRIGVQEAVVGRGLTEPALALELARVRIAWRR